MQVPARTGYAVRALLAPAAHAPDRISAGVVVDEQALPPKLIEGILGDLRDRQPVSS